MKTRSIKQLTLIITFIFFAIHFANAQFFPSGGYQGGTLGSGGDEILVGITIPTLSVQNMDFTVFPNPFHDNATLQYTLAAPSTISLDLYDIKHRILKTFLSPSLIDKGTYTILWDGNGDNGNKLARGIYYIKFTAGKNTTIRKIVIL